MVNKFIPMAIGLVALIFLVSGCSTVDVKRYAGQQPEFDLFDYFIGQTRGWGIVQDRKGELVRQFVVDINGYLNAAGELVLDEQFVWSDGEHSERIWTITKTGPHEFIGRAADVVGVAEGEVYGNALFWTYVLNLEARGSTWKVRFDDWMFLQPDGVLLNRATMSKFGFELAQVTIAFQSIDSTGGEEGVDNK
ncbi:DUF3833 domain-containing protein [Pelovirga terrestris]|uniref:DUF3833 domain-containing protein n=1 Tax=Pelovirga terrestris TaxID=2771352 RepID=A0A8J6R6X4_9BACT|nr:DUF3833 domain-containing protein [Pelovirga terrestris]MBD1401829.1 DUF3833 domain-containing protein [Pelovirga terrestris]